MECAPLDVSWLVEREKVAICKNVHLIFFWKLAELCGDAVTEMGEYWILELNGKVGELI